MGRYFLILNGCWLWVFCVSWKKLDKADVWACSCSSQFVESCVIQSDEALRASRTIGIFFFVGFSHKGQTKISLMNQKLLWETLLLPNCFCFSGSNVSCNRFGMGVYLMLVKSCDFFIPQQRRLFSCLAIFRLLRWKILTVIYLHVLFSELGVALRDLSWGSPACWNSKVFPPVGFQQTWCFGTHEILKKLFVISR